MYTLLLTVGTPGRDVNFNDKAASLSEWSMRAARTGRMVAAGGSGGNKKLAESLVSAAGQVSLTLCTESSVKTFCFLSVQILFLVLKQAIMLYTHRFFLGLFYICPTCHKFYLDKAIIMIKIISIIEQFGHRAKPNSLSYLSSA